MAAQDRSPARRENLAGGLLQPDTTDREHHLARVARLRRAGIVAALAWPLFALVDLFIVNYVHPGRLWVYLTLRAIGLVALLVSVLIVYRVAVPSRRAVRFVDIFLCTVCSVLLTISTLEYNGIASPLVVGVVMVILVRSAVLSDPWRRGLLPVGLSVGLYPATLAIMAIFSPFIASQFGDSRALATFALNMMFLVGAGAIVVVGGHLVWELRKEVQGSQSLGRYRLKERIGAGGMGEVWLAYHSALRRDVAVKILRHENASDNLATARFEREVRATSELSHPNTVRVYDYGHTADGLWYYAMEYLDGYDLHEIVARHGPVHPARAVKLIAQAARALAEAHSRGIIHRDIKPENLFLTSLPGEGDFIKVLDFGLAKVMQPDGEIQQSLTQVGWAVGTPQYVSPEVVFGREADARSDIYALGAVLFFLLCGSPPFNSRDMRRILNMHMKQAPDTPSQRLGRPLPSELEALVMRCLEKEPKRRFQSAGELAAALDALTTDQLRPRRRPTTAGAAVRRPRKPTGRRPVDPRRVTAVIDSDKLFGEIGAVAGNGADTIRTQGPPTSDGSDELATVRRPVKLL